jgi:serine/threonine-protein kinase
MGVVYLARQSGLERDVVLKKIRRDLLADPEIVERFQREARAAAGVHHQNVVTVYHCFTSRGDHFIAQEFVDGVDLRAVIDRVGRLEATTAARIALEVARGLEEIHARGIVHRDLKPGNILIGRGGETKIADFGIAFEIASEELTRPGTMLGSLSYMSPEQMLGGRIDYRSDLFSFGILLYEMVTGRTPFRDSAGDTTRTMLERMQRERYLSPRKHGVKMPGYLRRLIRACLRGRPSRRIRSATEIRRQLERRLRAASPADCRVRIEEFLLTHGIVQPPEDETRPEVSRSRPRERRATRPARWLLPAAAAAALILFAVGNYAVRLSTGDGDGPLPGEQAAEATPEQPPIASLLALAEASGLQAADRTEGEPVSGRDPLPPPSSEAADEPPPVAGRIPAPVVPPELEPARVRFVVDPWAKVHLDDGTSFLTPRARPAELAPGSHRVVLEHPRFGRAEMTVDLVEGEERVIRHTFDRGER